LLSISENTTGLLPSLKKECRFEIYNVKTILDSWLSVFYGKVKPMVI